ncbi:MAG TPA: hypothetical protein VFM07_02305 [Intrasporangium sp.]|nr:hypothetical protein [Intrasporangium sp.]
MAATPPDQDRTRAETLRRRVAVATVIACMPYLLLKICWVAGLSIGANDPTFADTTRGANVVTAGLEVAATLLAVAFVHPLGRRIPAFLLAFPMWVATGLLAPVVAGFALGTPAQLLSGAGNPLRSDVLDGWVFVLVYGGFVLQAVLLTVGFALHARERWPAATGVDPGRRIGQTVQAGAATSGLEQVLGTFFVVSAVLFALQQTAWSITGGGSFVDPTVAQRVMLLSGAGIAAAAAVMGRQLFKDGRLTTARVAVVWTGGAVVFTSALVETLKKVAIAPGDWGATTSAPGDAVLTLFVLLGVLGGSIGAAMRLGVAHEHAGRDGQEGAREGSRSEHQAQRHTPYA